ncbi:MAG: hypothetical protein ACE5JX_14535 [Acidobacteriota bacterium]
MKRLISITSIWYLFFTAAFSQADSAPANGNLRGLELSRVDYARLEREVRKRDLAIPEERFARTIQRNFQFLFLNNLNRERFLVTPRPRKVADTIVTILHLDDRLHELLRRCRAFAADSEARETIETRSRRRQMIREIGRVAARLNRVFSHTFVELQQSSYRIPLLRSGTEAGRIRRYLAEADRIHLLLTQEINDYFFNVVPGSIVLSRFQHLSIMVLSEALTRLSKLTVKGLGKEPS